jgi:hypothetical protein
MVPSTCRALAWVLLALPLACSSGKEPTERAVATFRADYARGAYGAIYTGGGLVFKGSMPKEEFVDSMAAVQRKLGAVKGAKLMSRRFLVNAGVTQVTESYDTEFERGRAREHFVWRVQYGLAVLYSYRIEPQEP